MYYKKITHFRKSTINFIWDQINPPWKKKAMRYEDTSILFFFIMETLDALTVFKNVEGTIKDTVQLPIHHSN